MLKTMRRGAIRHSSANPAAQSSQWCTVRMARATSARPAGSGSAEPPARTAGPAPGGRCPIMTPEGSTATTARSAGS